MKFYKTLFLIFLSFNYLIAQIDTTNWYPLNIGNKWEYSYGLEEVYYYSVEVIGDTIMPNGKTYQILDDDGDIKYQRNEGNKFVYVYNSSDSTESVLYDFISKDSTFWNVPYENLFWGIQVTKREYNYYFDKYTNFKYFDWVKIDSSNNGIDTIWNAMIDVYPTRIAQGIGVTNYDYSNYPGSGGLVGAVINGDTLGTLTSIKDTRLKPNSYNIYQNYPNPFNPSTTIRYSLPKNDFVNLVIYNTLGQKVSTLVNEYQTSGKYSVQFNASNLPSGVYFYKIESGNFIKVNKMLLLR